MKYGSLYKNLHVFDHFPGLTRTGKQKLEHLKYFIIHSSIKKI